MSEHAYVSSVLRCTAAQQLVNRLHAPSASRLHPDRLRLHNSCIHPEYDVDRTPFRRLAAHVFGYTTCIASTKPPSRVRFYTVYRDLPGLSCARPGVQRLTLDMNSLQNSTSGSPASALRELFREKPPEITRKITACVACRKQKV